MNQIQEFLNGKKTHTVAIGIILTAIGSLLSGDTDLQQTIILILNGLGLSTLRAGVAKSK